MSARGDRSVNIGRRFEATVFSDYLESYLNENSIIEILLNNEKLGSADDIGFLLKGRLLVCIQAKGAEEDFTCNLSDLFGNNSKKSVVEKLFITFKQIKKEFPNYKFKIYYVTSKSPSQSARSTKYMPIYQNEKISLQKFIKQYWQSFKNNEISEDNFLQPGILNEWFKLFKDHLNCEEQILFDFLKKLNFEFNVKFYKERSVYEKTKKRKYYNWFLNKKNSIKNSVTIEQFLQDIGYYYDPLLHDFPYNENEYIKRGELSNNIRSSIDKLNKGYLFLEGGAGLGKSTFLQAEINETAFPKYIIFRYLCFRDDRHYTLKVRGESDIFFKEMNIQFSNFLGESSFNLSEEEKFNELINSLSNLTSERNTKVLVIIDGIDHVLRMQRATQPFLEKLPTPRQLPDNVIILLSGQHFNDISWFRDLDSYTDLISKFEVEPFYYEQVEEFLFKKYSRKMGIIQISQILEKTGGNPQYLNIICNKYPNLADLQNFEEKLEEFIDFEENIYKLYDAYWQKFNFNSNEEYLKIAGLISRLIGPIDVNWLIIWPEIKKIERFFNNFDFLFLKIENLYLFKYNTFKDFLFEKSAKYLQIFSENKSKEYYSILNDYCDNYNSSGVHNWYKLYYLLYSDNKDDILKLDRSYFLNQFIQFRPVCDILEDLTEILNFLHEIKDFKKFFEFFFLKGEFEIRNNIYEENFGYLSELLNFFINDFGTCFYVLITTLHSQNLDYNLKLDLIIQLLNINNITGLVPFLKDFYNQNKATIPNHFFHQDLLKYIDDWTYIAIKFESITSILNSFDLILSELFNHKIRGPYYLNSDFFGAIYVLGEYLIENNRFTDLAHVYRYLEKIIEKGGWKVYSFRHFRYKNKDTNNFASHWPQYDRMTPFGVILQLKIYESYAKEEDLITDFLDQFPFYHVLWDNDFTNTRRKYNLFFHPDKISDNDVRLLFKDGPRMRFSLYGDPKSKILSRINLYKNLLDIWPIQDDKKLLDIFNSNYQINNLDHLLMEKEHYYFRWELNIRDFAILSMGEIDEEQMKNVISNILNLMDCEPSINLHWYYYFKDFMAIFIDQIGLLSESIKDFFLETLKQKFYIGKGKFQSFLTQLQICIRLKQIFKNDVLDDLIKEILQKNLSAILNITEPWENNDTFLVSLKASQSIRITHQLYVDQNIPKFEDFYKKISFRIGPRKDYQLFFLKHLLKNIIKFFDEQDEQFIREIHWIVEILNFVSDNTEKNSINFLKECFLHIIEDWNHDLFLEIKKKLTYFSEIYNSDIEPVKKTEIIIDESIVKKLYKKLMPPEEFIIEVKKISEQRNAKISLRALLYKVYSIDKDVQKWINLFNYLTKDRPYLGGFLKYPLNYVLTNFFKKIFKENEELEEKYNIQERLALAKLYAPTDREAHYQKINEVYEINPDLAFNWGWETLKNIINMKKYVWYVIVAGEEWIIYTFLPIINDTNYKVYWGIYMNYLRNLFDFITLE